MPQFGLNLPGGQYIDPRSRMAQQLMEEGMSSAPVGHWAQGLGRLAQTLAGAYIQNKLRGEQGDAMSRYANPEKFVDDPAKEANVLNKYWRENSQDMETMPKFANVQVREGKPSMSDMDTTRERYALGMNDPDLFPGLTDQMAKMQAQNAMAGRPISMDMSMRTQPDPVQQKMAGENPKMFVNLPGTNDLRPEMSRYDMTQEALSQIPNNPIAQQLSMMNMDRRAGLDAEQAKWNKVKEWEIFKMLQGQGFDAQQNQLNRENAQTLKGMTTPQPGSNIPYPEDVYEQKVNIALAGAPKWEVQKDSSGNPVQVNTVTGERKPMPPPSISAGQKAVDTAFGKDYAEYYASGLISDSMKNLNQLDSVVADLQGVVDGKSKDNITGPVLGRMPDWVTSMTNPKAVAVRQTVEEVVQRNLRIILGAQFTAKEGENLIARAFNPALDEAENLKRVNRLVKSMRSALEGKQKAAEYFEKHNGTLAGYKGQVEFSMADFYNALESGNDEKPRGKRAGDAPSQGGSDIMIWDSKSGKLVPDRRVQ
ncbi:MAG: hypothetical protein OEY89_02395 [Gammaproteobacteria bacterium]|nr:hypothetical protein [Gammaproteobacteria bacterium]